MAAIASTNVEVTVAPAKREMAGAGAFKNFTQAQIKFGNGTLTYPTGGVPLPALGAFGLHKGIDLALIEQPPANGFVYKFDRANHKIKIFTQGVRTGSTDAAAAENGALVKDSSGAEAAAPRLPKTAINSTYDLGPMIELPATIAPAEVTLDVLLIGE